LHGDLRGIRFSARRRFRVQGQALVPVRYWFKQAEEAVIWSEVEKAMENLWAA
jgi:hypothetical protein